MAEFLIALAVDPVEEGRGYGSLPLHCTVLQWFDVRDDVPTIRQLIRDFREVCEAEHALTLETSSFNGAFGPERNTPVHTLYMTTELWRLHRACMGLVEQVGGTLRNPEWCGKNYRPHITITNGKCVAIGHRVIAQQLYLAEKIPLLAPYTRFIRTAVTLI